MHFVDKSGAKILPDRRNPATEPDVLAVGGSRCPLKGGVNAVGDKVKRRAAAHGERGTGMVCEDEDRRVVGRIVAPPSFPALVEPRPADRPKHVASQDPRADVAETARRKFVVGSGRAALSAMHPLKGAGGKRPFVQRAAAGAERIVAVLVGSGAVTVKRQREAVHAKFRHEISSDVSSDCKSHHSRASKTREGRSRLAERAARRGRAQRPRVTHFCALTIAKEAPCGSRACTIHAPPGTSVGPCRTCAPRACARSAACATLSTAM